MHPLQLDRGGVRRVSGPAVADDRHARLLPLHPERRGESVTAGPAPCDCGKDCPSTGTHCVVYVVSTRVSGGTSTEGWSAHSGGAVGVDGAAGVASGACPAPDEGAL